MSKQLKTSHKGHPLNSRLTHTRESGGKEYRTKYGYDEAGELKSEDGPWANDTVSYTYTSRLRTALSLQQPSGSAWTNGYGYDAARRLTNVTSPAGAFSYSYLAPRAMLPAALSLPNGAFVTNTYDSVARLLSTALESSGGTNLDFESYGYNQGNQRTQQVFTAGNFDNYTYDNIGQLKSATGKESGGVTNRLQEQFGYFYDAAGNLNFRTNNALVQTFNVNNLNELSSATRSGTLTVAGSTTLQATNVTVNTSNAVLYLDLTFASSNQSLANGNNTFTAKGWDIYGRTNVNSITVNLPATNGYSYDLNGNLLSDGNRYFAYDDENQLTSAWVTNVWRSDFAYDGKMRRRIRKEYAWQSGVWVQTNELHYIYDGNLVIQERDTNNVPQVTYTRGNDLSGSFQGAGGIGGLLVRTDVDGPAFYHADGNGNVTMMIDANQAIVAKYEYDPYGNILSQSGALADANLYRFSSKEFHLASGLIYYLYRFYDPSLQRWLNRDPLGESGFAVVISGLPNVAGSGQNLYEDVYNSPINYKDPYGLSFLSKCKDVCRGLFGIAKEKAKDKIKDEIKDKLKEWFTDKAGGQSAKDAKEACDQISKCSPDNDVSPANWAIKCQLCAVYKCAISASSVLAADICLKGKLANCLGGISP